MVYYRAYSTLIVSSTGEYPTSEVERDEHYLPPVSDRPNPNPYYYYRYSFYITKYISKLTVTSMKVEFITNRKDTTQKNEEEAK